MTELTDVQNICKCVYIYMYVCMYVCMYVEWGAIAFSDKVNKEKENLS